MKNEKKDSVDKGRYSDVITALEEKLGYLGTYKDNAYIRGMGPVACKSLSSIERLLNLRQFLKAEGFYDLYFKYISHKNTLLTAIRAKEYVTDEIQEEKKMAKKQREDTKRLYPEAESNKLISTLREDCIVFRTYSEEIPELKHTGIDKGLNIVIFNKKTRSLIDPRKFRYSALLELLGIDIRDIGYRDDLLLVSPVFNPTRLEITFREEVEELAGSDILRLNLANPPYFIKEGIGGYDSSIEAWPRIHRLIKHLFLDKEEIEKIYDWCHYLLTSRNETTLCLAGDRGTGKSTFCDVLSVLVGKDYSELVNSAIFTDKFNSQFHNKRLIVFDELEIDEKAVTKIKAWSNSRIAIEKKNLSAFSAINWSSMIILLNDIGRLKISPQERRFSVPKVTEDSLFTSFSVEEVNEFKRGLDLSSKDALREVGNFGKFLLERVPSNSNHTPIKGEYYFEISDITLTQWQKVTLEYLLNVARIGVPFFYKEIKKILSKSDVRNSHSPDKDSSLKRWFSDYRFRGEHKIAHIVYLPNPEIEKFFPKDKLKRTGNTFVIMPNEEFLRKHSNRYKGRSPSDISREAAEYINSIKGERLKEEQEEMEAGNEDVLGEIVSQNTYVSAVTLGGAEAIGAAEDLL